MIQGYQIQGQVYSMDTDLSSRRFAVGTRECINILSLSVEDQYWFQSKHKITKYRACPQAKPLVNDLAWNKSGKDYLAIGTTHGYAFVYDLSQDKQNQCIFTCRGNDSGMIKKIVWQPASTDIFYTASFQNYLAVYDVRVKEQCKIYQYDTSMKFRDLKFNPQRHNVLAVSYYSDVVELFDVRKMEDSFIKTSRDVVDQLGSAIDWDPNCATRLATAGSKSINIWSWIGSKMQKQEPKSTPYWYGGTLKQQQYIDHFSIKTFKWLKEIDSYAISDQYIYFYNLKNSDRAEKVFGGNSKTVDCWIMDQTQQIIISASMSKNKNKEKTKQNQGNASQSNSIIVAQFRDNGIDPHQERLNHPVSFSIDNCLAFTCNGQQHKYATTLQGFPNNNNCKKLVKKSLRQQLQYLHFNYLWVGKNQQISVHNSKIALQLGKTLCAQMWQNIFNLAFPKPQQYHTVSSFFENHLKSQVEVENNCIVVNKIQSLHRNIIKLDISTILQHLVDQNQLQTAVIAAIIISRKDPERTKIIDIGFIKRIMYPYIQVLRNLQIYVLAAKTILETQLSIFTDTTKSEVKFQISCGSCKKSITKGECFCNTECIICQQSLKEKIVIWCKYCGHGWHASQSQQNVKNKKNVMCCQGCNHQCFFYDPIEIQTKQSQKYLNDE